MSSLKAIFFTNNILIEPGSLGTGKDFDKFVQAIRDAFKIIVANNYSGLGVVNLLNTAGKTTIIIPTEKESKVTEEGKVNLVSISLNDAFGKSKTKGPGYAPDEIVLHELVHALQHADKLAHISFNIDEFLYVEDLRSGTPVAFNYHFTHEFQAILISNIYMSAKGRGYLRMDHMMGALPSQYYSDENFLNIASINNRHGKKSYDTFAHKHLVDSLIRNFDGLCYNYIRHDNGIFNPVRYYLNHLKSKDRWDLDNWHEKRDDIRFNRPQVCSELLGDCL